MLKQYLINKASAISPKFPFMHLFFFPIVPISTWEARPCQRTVSSPLIHPLLRQMKPFSPHTTAFMAKSNPYRYYKNFLFTTFGSVY